MKGMADIHSRFSDSKGGSHVTSPIRERPTKKEIYENIIRNLDIFDFFDMDQNEEADQSGNSSEPSIGPQDSITSTQRDNRLRDRRDLNLDDVEDLIEQEHNNKNGKVFGRKTTIDTNSYMKQSTQKRSDEMPSPGYNHRTSSNNYQLTYRKTNPLRRLHTFTDQAGVY